MGSSCNLFPRNPVPIALALLFALATVSIADELVSKALSGKRFETVEEYECGLGPNGPVFWKWHVGFGGYLETVPPLLLWYWDHSDQSQSGTLSMDETGNITAGGSVGPDIKAKFNRETNELIWDGIRYVLSPQEVRYKK